VHGIDAHAVHDVNAAWIAFDEVMDEIEGIHGRTSFDYNEIGEPRLASLA
jgi:hypothetical protein